MPSKRRSRYWTPRLWRLEDRITPAAINTLVTQPAPSLVADNGGGGSLVSLSLGSTASGAHLKNVMSADGRYTAFTSFAPNLVPGQIDSAGFNDVFVYDRVANTTELISHAPGAVSVAS